MNTLGDLRRFAFLAKDIHGFDRQSGSWRFLTATERVNGSNLNSIASISFVPMSVENRACMTL